MEEQQSTLQCSVWLVDYENGLRILFPRSFYLHVHTFRYHRMYELKKVVARVRVELELSQILSPVVPLFIHFIVPLHFNQNNKFNFITISRICMPTQFAPKRCKVYILFISLCVQLPVFTLTLRVIQHNTIITYCCPFLSIQIFGIKIHSKWIKHISKFQKSCFHTSSRLLARNQINCANK